MYWGLKWNPLIFYKSVIWIITLRTVIVLKSIFKNVLRSHKTVTAPSCDITWFMVIGNVSSGGGGGGVSSSSF